MTVGSKYQRLSVISMFMGFYRLVIAEALLVSLTLLGGGQALAGHVNCGDVLTANTTLDEDLTCSFGTALIIDTDKITLNLNGHTITGLFPDPPDCPFCSRDGVLVSGHTGVTIKNGTISGFLFGIRLDNAHNNVIKGIVTTNNTFNGISMFNDSDGNQIKDCTSSNNEIKENIISSNLRRGVFIRNSDHNVVKNNTINENGTDDATPGTAGILLILGADNNELKGNVCL